MPETIPCQHESDFVLIQNSLDEIKDTLKAVSEVLTKNALLEQRVLGLQEQVNEQGARLRSVELSIAKQHGHSVWIQRILWGIASLLIGTGLYYMR